MEIRVDGNRSTSESWLAAHRIPTQDLPEITAEEQIVAEKLSISAEDYRRSKYAAELTKLQLESRSRELGLLVEDWLQMHRVSANVGAVWLKTFEGKFRVDVRMDARVEHIFLTEDLVNDILDSGSKQAQKNLDRLLSANFLLYEAAQAS